MATRQPVPALLYLVNDNARFAISKPAMHAHYDTRAILQVHKSKQ